MSNNELIQKYLYIWERDYRSFMQGVRSGLAILCVVLIYYFVRDSHLLFMGVCVFSLSLSCVRSPYWPIEINLLLAFFISTAAILMEFPFSLSFWSLSVYIFFITFSISLFLYFKISSIYSFWIYLIPLTSVLSIKEFNDVLKHVYMNTIAFSICFFISIVFLRPKIQRECLFEIKSILRELLSYVNSVEEYTFNKSNKKLAQLARKRKKIFIRIQMLRLMLTEIELYRKKEKFSHKNNLFVLFILVTLTERFVETTIGISIKMRILNVPFEYESVVKSIFKLIHKTNNDLLNFLIERKEITVQELDYLYEKIYLNALVEYKKIEKLNEKYSEDIAFKEIFSSIFQLKDNISLLNSEFKFLCQKE